MKCYETKCITIEVSSQWLYRSDLSISGILFWPVNTMRVTPTGRRATPLTGTPRMWGLPGTLWVSWGSDLRTINVVESDLRTINIVGSDLRTINFVESDLKIINVVHPDMRTIRFWLFIPNTTRFLELYF